MSPGSSGVKCWPTGLAVAGSRPAQAEIFLNCKRGSIAHSLLLPPARRPDMIEMKPSRSSIHEPHCKKNIRRFYGKITGNKLSVHFPLFFTHARKHFQESGTER